MTSRLVALLATLVATSALHAESSVWKVTRGGNTIYIGGTCHTLRPSDLPIPTEYDMVFSLADTFVFETDIARMQSPEAQGKILAQAVYADGTKVSSVLSKEAWDAFRGYCRDAGVPAGAFESFKPSILAVTVIGLEAQRLGFTPEGVDVQLDKRARAAGKAVQGLETLDEQIAFIINMGAGHESEMLVSTLRDLKELPGLLDQILAAWRSGDLNQIDALLSADMRDEFPEIYQDLLVRRNQAWLPKIETMLASPPVEFVLVGVAHVAGKDGLLQALKDRGCTVEQVTAPRA